MKLIDLGDVEIGLIGYRAVSPRCYMERHEGCPGTTQRSDRPNLSVPCECRCHAAR